MGIFRYLGGFVSFHFFDPKISGDMIQFDLYIFFIIFQKV